MKSFVLAGLFLLLTVIVSSAQMADSGPVSGVLTVRNGLLAGNATFTGPGLLHEEHITGQPYSAIRVSVHSQTLTDGTHIRQKRETEKIYRDSEGRSRTEQKLFRSGAMLASARAGLEIVRIYDPVAGYSYLLDSEKKIAHRAAIPASGFESRPVFTRLEGAPPLPSAAKRLSTAPRREIKKEPLGSKMMEGVEAVGERFAITTPEGLEGNDRPMTRVCEHWQSEELKITLLSKCSDPRTGTTALRLDHLDRSEPAPMLFQVPADYTVVDDHGPFRIGFGTPQRVHPTEESAH